MLKSTLARQIEADIEILKKEISNELDEIIILKLQAESYFQYNLHQIIVTPDGTKFYMSELDIEECCPMINEISTIYYESGVKHLRVDIESDIMAEIFSFIYYGRFTNNVQFTGSLFKIITMLELDLMRIVGEFLLIRQINFLTIFSLLQFSVKYKLSILEEKIITTIAAYYDIFKGHQEWIPFARNNLPVTVKIFERIKFYQNKLESLD